MVKHKESGGSELTRIRRLQSATGRTAGRGVVLGIGDDCAIFRPKPDADLLFTTDLLIEEVHFRRDTHRPEDIGWKALARGLSDIAAMGGAPRFCLLSLALPNWAGDRWIDSFYRGLWQLATAEKAPLIGGDMAHAEKLTCDIHVCGDVPRGDALRRDGARSGHAIYVSGALGASALGLETRRGPAWKRHLRPQPRIALGRFLRERLHATACMDLSDGLSIDLHRLALASGLAAEIQAPPLFRGASLAQALHGGEDYELLFTLPAAAVAPPDYQGIPLTRIGTMRKGRPGALTLDGAALPPLGYDHFQSR